MVRPELLSERRRRRVVLEREEETDLAHLAFGKDSLPSLVSSTTPEWED